MTKEQREEFIAEIELHRTFVTFGIQKMRRYSLSSPTRDAWVAGMRMHANELVRVLDKFQEQVNEEKQASLLRQVSRGF